MKVILTLAALAAVLAEPEARDSGLAVEYVSKPDSCDRVARNGDMLEMHYTGTLEDGKKFDSSYDRSEPFKFQIGVGQVIKGWEEGVLGMCIGEKRRLIVPPALGYGDQGNDHDTFLLLQSLMTISYFLRRWRHYPRWSNSLL